MNTKNISDFYNAAGVPEDNGPFSPHTEILLDRIREYCEKIIFPGAKVLEIGSGNGRYSFAFEKMGALPVGIDCAGEVVEYAVKTAAEIGSRAEFVCDDALNMPFADKSFDIIFLVGNNISDFSYQSVDSLCRTGVKVLKDGGLFCVSMNDGFLHENGKYRAPEDYDAFSGKIHHRFTVPGKGTFDYYSFYWTVLLAVNLFKRYFSVVSVEQTDEKRFWIQCEK